MFFPFVFSLSKLNLVLVSSAKMTALQPAVFYLARELVLVQYEQGMLCSGMNALRKQESVSCTSSFSGVVHSPGAGDRMAALWIFTALSQLHEAHFDFRGERHNCWTRGSRWKGILHLCSAQTLLCLMVVVGCAYSVRWSKESLFPSLRSSIYLSSLHLCSTKHLWGLGRGSGAPHLARVCPCLHKGCSLCLGLYCRIIKSYRLKKTLKITVSNC